MFAVVGLGNPGSRYRYTRHNLGWRIVEALAARTPTGGLGSGERWQEKLGCAFMRARVPLDSGREEELLLVLPQQYMNKSGEAAVPLLRFYKVDPERVVVVHDELDLAPGQIRCKLGGSTAGHRGVEDLGRHLGTDKFYRLRVGIGHPRRVEEQLAALRGETVEKGASTGASVRGRRSEQDVSSWVLSSPGPDEEDLLEKAIPEAADAILLLVREGLQAVQQQYHRR